MVPRTVTLVATTLLAISTVISGAVEQTAVSVRRTGLIVGQVVDANTGRPISGAIVTLAGMVTPSASGGMVIVNPGAAAATQPRILTGADGRFVFRDLPRGSFGIGATKSPLSLAASTSGVRVDDTRTVHLGDTSYSIGSGGAIPPAPAGDRLFIYPPTFHLASSTAMDALQVSIASGEERDGIDLHLRPVRTVRVSGIAISGSMLRRYSS